MLVGILILLVYLIICDVYIFISVLLHTLSYNYTIKIVYSICSNYYSKI